MSYLTWQDWMTVGIPMVDADHQILVSLINQVHACMESGQEYATMASVLQSLADYTDYHFHREEVLLREVGYPELDSHVAMHGKLSGQVRQIGQRYRNSTDSLRAKDVQGFLEQWLVDHILKHDMAYRPFALGRDDAQRTAAQIDIYRAGRASAAKPALPRKSFDWQSLCVLVVDDNDHFLSLMDTILGGVGVGIVKTVRSAAQGLDELRHRPVDVVISDWHMDAMDGIDFVSRIRASADPIVSQVPVLMVTGQGDREIRQKALSAGVTDYIEKPISARDLLLTLTHAVTARRA